METNGAVSWLPANTSPPPALQALLAAAVDDWSRRWFAGSSLALGPLHRGVGTGFSWRGLGDGLGGGLLIGCAPAASVEIGARVLDVPAQGRGDLNSALLEEVAEDCLTDLRARLAALVKAPRGVEWRPLAVPGGWTATLGGARAPLAIGLSDPLFAALLRQVLPPAATGPLGSGAAALADTPVVVSAAIGRSALSVADLRALGVGDVVVLDRALADPVPLAVDGGALARGQARVVADPHPVLQIVAAVA